MPAAEAPFQTKESLITFETSQGVHMQGTPVKLSRFQVVFEAYSPALILRASEVLGNFKILMNDRLIYSGRALVCNIVNAGTTAVCEAKLEDSWLDVESSLVSTGAEALCAGFSEFLNEWQRVYRIMPEYKGIVADMQSFLTELRLWLDQVELGVRSAPAGDRVELERNLAQKLGAQTNRALSDLFEKFEFLTDKVEREVPEQRAAHGAFAKRLLHPLLLASPFLYRTFQKPLGYAGDYEMVNMICRDPFEGSSLFAKIINFWFLSQPPAEAHRNRITYLMERLSDAALAALRKGRLARIVSVGCGPAFEIQRFIAESELANHVKLVLIDFNEETLAHTRALLDNLKRANSRRVSFEVVRKSVNQILKEGGRAVPRTDENTYDFVYCAGLFDYLSDQMCRRLSSILYNWVAPGGLLVTTNVDSSNPRRLTMDYIMDWHLIYRSGMQLSALGPEVSNGESGSITADATGVNIHYALRRPEHG